MGKHGNGKKRERERKRKRNKEGRKEGRKEAKAQEKIQLTKHYELKTHENLVK